MRSVLRPERWARRAAPRMLPALPALLLVYLVIGPACVFDVDWLEVENQTDSTITVSWIIEGESAPLYPTRIAPGELAEFKFNVAQPETRWEITKEDGVVLMEVAVSHGLIDFYDGRIVVR